MAITEMPALDRSSPTFRAEVDLYLGTQLPTFSTQVEAARVEILAAEAAAEDSKDAALVSELAAAASATGAAAVALSAANFSGTWASLTGALNVPAAVFHNGAYWMLLNNLADVTTSQPGVSADWQVVGGAFPIVPISTNTTAVPGKTYLMTAACTLTMPAISGNGKQVGLIVLPGVSAASFAPAGSDKTRGASGTQTIDGPFSATLTDSGATYGWV